MHDCASCTLLYTQRAIVRSVRSCGTVPTQPSTHDHRGSDHDGLHSQKVVLELCCKDSATHGQLKVGQAQDRKDAHPLMQHVLAALLYGARHEHKGGLHMIQRSLAHRSAMRRLGMTLRPRAGACCRTAGAAGHFARFLQACSASAQHWAPQCIACTVALCRSSGASIQDMFSIHKHSTHARNIPCCLSPPPFIPTSFSLTHTHIHTLARTGNAFGLRPCIWAVHLLLTPVWTLWCVHPCGACLAHPTCRTWHEHAPP